MLERTTTRTLPLVSRVVDLAPAAQACCGACRTCATTNVLGVAFAWALAPGGEPRPIAVQCALAVGLGAGLLTAQRARPSPTRWALAFGAVGLILAWRTHG